MANSDSLLEAALAYARKGYRVFPLHSARDGRCSCSKPNCPNVGKHPRIAGGFKNATSDEAKIRKWWKKWPDANIGVALSADTAVLDFDGEPSPKWKELIDTFPCTVTQSTRRGFHYFFKNTTAIQFKNGTLDRGIDLKTEGGYVVVAPSAHLSGQYAWLGGRSLLDLEPAPLPDSVLRLYCRLRGPVQSDDSGPCLTTALESSAYGERALADECEKIRSARIGERNNTLNRSVYKIEQLIAGGELNGEESRKVLEAAAYDAGLDGSEIKYTLRSARLAGAARPRSANGNSPAAFEQVLERPAPAASQNGAGANINSCGAHPSSRRHQFPAKIEKHYESLKIEDCNSTTALRKLKHLVEHHYPRAWKTLEAGLAAVATGVFAHNERCLALILVGRSGAGKTLPLSCIMPDAGSLLEQHFYRSDRFTAASFVSHRADRSSKQLQEIDLLPKLKGRTLITPELAPLFRGKKDELIERFAVLTRVLDGDGYQTDSGAQGRRGYTGKFTFRWLGATTPLEEAAVKAMGHLGPRLLFFEVDRPDSADDEFAEVVFGDSRELGDSAVKTATQDCLRKLYNTYSKAVRNSAIEFPEDLKPVLLAIARMLVRLRAPILREGGDIRAQTEHPERVAHALRDLALGRALLYGRKAVTGNDLRFARHIALSSGSPGRQQVMRALIEAGGEASMEDLATATGRSRPFLQWCIKQLHCVGLVQVAPGGGRGNQTVVTMAAEYQSVLLRPEDRCKPETKKRWGEER